MYSFTLIEKFRLIFSWHSNYFIVKYNLTVCALEVFKFPHQTCFTLAQRPAPRLVCDITNPALLHHLFQTTETRWTWRQAAYIILHSQTIIQTSPAKITWEITRRKRKTSAHFSLGIKRFFIKTACKFHVSRTTFSGRGRAVVEKKISRVRHHDQSLVDRKSVV